MIRRRIAIRFQTAFHHGSGFGIAGLVDRAVLRDAYGMPHLAGSAIKGRVRHATLRILLTEGGSPCRYGDQKRICRDKDPCSLCTMFGSPYRQGCLFFSDAYPSESLKSMLAGIQEVSRSDQNKSIRLEPLFRDSSVRPGTSIDRIRRTVREKLLFSTETLPDFLVFEGEICGSLDESQEALLKKAGQVLTHFGADASRGLGRCTTHIERVP